MPVAETTQPRSSRSSRYPGVSTRHISKFAPEFRIHKSLPKGAGSTADKDALHFPASTPPTRGMEVDTGDGCSELPALPSTRHVCQCAKVQASPFRHPSVVPKNLHGICFLASSVFLEGRREPFRDEGVLAPFLACALGFAAAFGFGTSFPFASKCL